ncbi:MAG: hypothetical protein KGJ23_12595 [Euryarchaeota archaeon]|nr:hypothetical protein [Euryarchaeota archaeon]MDE1837437.1 hypothetical protein [Euryarchaeota archaeon]MDE1882243.1 hypothetical protein [Euryarchaeota archaeon]MDE2045597.1 hypothetical protein [Thermoplasmata archaeon]
MFEHGIIAICSVCGARVETCPPNLPSTGGFANFHDDPVNGWVVESFVCGACLENRPRTWTCAHCGGSGPEWSNFCSQCHGVRPDPLPYVPDWDLLAKEERERKREHDALAAEWDGGYPEWRMAGSKRSERL